MNFQNYLPGVVCIAVALLIMFRLMHYAHFYAPSYFFWIGLILALVGTVSLIKPLCFLFITSRTIAGFVLCGGILVSFVSLYVPTKLYHSNTHFKIDTLMPDYSFNEYHEVIINASPEAVKRALQTTAVADIPVVHLLLKIRGIADDKDMRDKVTNIQSDPNTLSTPDFNFFVVDSTELITVMILKASSSTPPPEISSIDQFKAFDQSGYVKVAVNFRIIDLENGQTLISTETRNYTPTKKDCRIFGRYWRIIYPGSAMIRRLWLDTLAKKAEAKAE